MSFRNTTVGVALATLLLTAGAQAATTTPKLANRLIVPNKSVGSLKLGQSRSAALAAWGKGTTCGAGGCVFGKEPTPASGRAQYSLAATIEGASPTVATIVLEAGPFGKKLNFKTPLASLKTSKGIGLGSTKAQLLRAYPHMTSAGANFYVIPFSPTDETIFGLLGGRVNMIAIGEHG
jgi:hypothetical protein